MSPKVRKFVKYLYLLSLENSKVSESKVQAILEAFRLKPPKNYHEILHSYKTKIASELRRANANIEYFGKLEDSTVKNLKESLEKHYNRDLKVNLKENSELIAGFRIHVADDVWDATIAARLENFSLSFNI